MKVLVVTPYCPFPPDKSGGVHTLNCLLKANAENEIDLIYYSDHDSIAEKEIEGLVNSVKFIPARKRMGVMWRILSILRNIPYAQFQYRPICLPERNNYDVILYDQFSSEPLVGNKCKARQVCFVHDSMPLYFKRKAGQSKHYLVRKYYAIESNAAKKCEGRYLQLADRLVFVSSEDSSYSKSIYGEDDKCSDIKLGIEEVENEPAIDIGMAIVFTGVLDYSPNEDAALYLLEKIFPSLLERFPDARLYLVGRNPTEKIRRAAEGKDSVVVTGHVDSVYPYIKGARVYVSPLRFGTGAKNKVLEAMRCGAPSVFSPVSVESIPEVKPGENCLIASTAEEWVSQVSLLLSDDTVRLELQNNLRQTFRNNRSWSSALAALIS